MAASTLIYGAGAIGSFVGFLLSDNEASGDRCVRDVALLGREDHIHEIRSRGLRVKLPSGMRTVWFENCFSSISEISGSDFTPDLVVICVKTHSLPGVSMEMKSSGLLESNLKGATFVLLMNGMGNVERLDLPSRAVFEGITSLGVKFSRKGEVELKGIGKTILENGIGPDIKRFLEQRFEKAGYDIEFSPDFGRQQWNKLIVNSVINPITALTGKNNEIILQANLRSTIERIVEEDIRVAGRDGVDFELEAAVQSVLLVASKTGQNTSSMLQDIQRGGMTEIDSINGYVVRLAKKHCLDVPINEAIYSLVKALEIPKSKELLANEAEKIAPC